MARRAPDDVPLRADYGEGCYRRCIVLESAPGRASGELVDDFHHFVAHVEHDGQRVTRIDGEAVRFPWTTCPGAVDPLASLVGAALTRDFAAIGRHTDSRLQCTHLYDVACLAVCQAARETGALGRTRRYDLVLGDRRAGRARATLERDREPLFDWTVEGLRLADATPDRFANAVLAGPEFAELIAAIDDPDLAEAALVMRRSIFIGLGRQYDFDRIPRASAFAPAVGAACHTFSATNADRARRIVGSVRDFQHRSGRLLERDTVRDKDPH